jgi:hypothetical protein
MDKFLESFQHLTVGVLSCFDRLIFRGHLGLGYPQAMERFINEKESYCGISKRMSPSKLSA